MNSIVCIRCNAVNHITRNTCFKCGVDFLSDAYVAPKKMNKMIPIVLIALLSTTALGFLSYKGLQMLNIFGGETSATEKRNSEQPNAIDIWNKYLEVSGEGANETKTVVMKGKMILTATDKTPVKGKVLAKGTYQFFAKDRNKIYAIARIDIPAAGSKEANLTVIQKFFDGQRGWEQKVEFEKISTLQGFEFTGNRNENTRQLTADEVADFQNEIGSRSIKDFHDFAFQSETTNGDGEQIYAISAINGKGVKIGLEINKQTNLLTSMRMPALIFETGKTSNNENIEKREKHITLMQFSNYKTVNGFQVPFEINAKAHSVSTKMIYDEIQINTDLPDDIFALKTIKAE